MQCSFLPALSQVASSADRLEHNVVQDSLSSTYNRPGQAPKTKTRSKAVRLGQHQFQS